MMRRKRSRRSKTSVQKKTGDTGADSVEAVQNTVSTLDPSAQNLLSNIDAVELPVEGLPGDQSTGLEAMSLRTITHKNKKRHRSASSGSSASDSSFNFEDMSAENFVDFCYHLGKSLHKKTSSMAREISALQQKVVCLEKSNAKVISLEEANLALMSSEAAARQEIERLKDNLAKAEGLLFTQDEQLKLRDQQLQKMTEESQQHLAMAKMTKADFEETLRQMKEAPAQNVVQEVVAEYKASPQTYEEIQIILAPALRRGYTLGVDEAKPADLVISTLPNHKLYDKKAGEIFTKRYDEYKSGEDIIRKYAKKKSAQASAPPSS